MSFHAMRCHTAPTAPLGVRTQDLAADARAAIERFTALPAGDARASRELSQMLAPRLQEAIANLPDGLVRTNLVNTREILDEVASGQRVIAPGGLNAQLSMMAELLAKAHQTSQFPERRTLRRALGAFGTLPNAVAARHAAPAPAPRPPAPSLQQRYDAMMARLEAMRARLAALAKPEPTPAADAAGEVTAAAAAPVAAVPPVASPPIAAPLPQGDGVGAVVTGIGRGVATVVGGVLAAGAGAIGGLLAGPFVGAAAGWSAVTGWFNGQR